MTHWHHLGFDSQLIIVHPSYRHHRYLLSTLLKQDNPLYLRFDNYEDCFNETSTGDFLILDEFDRFDTAKACQFLERVQVAYSEKAIIIFSRDLPNLSEGQRKEASLFPIDEEMGLVNYYQEIQPVVEFFGFGRGTIAVNGKPKEQYLLDTQLVFLFYLLEHGRTKRSTLMSVFWNELAPKTAIKALHNIKQNINMLLGIELIRFQDGHYQLNPDVKIVYDGANYRRLIETAYYAEPKHGMVYFSQAHDIYKANFLQLSQVPWVIAHRQKLMRTQADVQVYLAQGYAAKAQKEAAATWYSFAFKSNPMRDDVLLALMRLFVDLEKPSYALDFFKHYKTILQEQYGIRPSKDFDDLLGLVG